MTLRAYAKINLGLRILLKRPDGYHDIETVFCFINNFDEITLTTTDAEIVIETNSPDVPTDTTNLCISAAQLLRDITGVSKGVRIRLTKNIPVGAGLGGGSSDAAATLKGLVKVWNLALRYHELKQIALNLGSDVPYFLESTPAFATGRGENLEPMDLRLPYWILVVTPALQISTSWAYSKVKASGNSQAVSLKRILHEHLHSASSLLKLVQNDFEPLVFETYPEVKNIKETLLRLDAQFALMSGSGSSVFGFFSDEEKANIAALKFSRTYHTSLTEPSFSPPQSSTPGSF